MAVTVTSSISGPYIPNGATTVFAFDFKAASADEVDVYRDQGEGFVLVPSADYTAAVDPDQEGGTVEFAAAPAIGSGSLYIVSEPLFTREGQYTGEGPFTPKGLNSQFDKAAVRDLALKRDVDRAIKVPLGEEVDISLPSTSSRAGRYLAFDLAGKPVPASGSGADGALRTDLAGQDAGQGAELVRYNRDVEPVDGSVGRTLNILERRYVDLADYAASNDTTDAHAAVQAAFTEGHGREIVFSNPRGGLRYYRSLTRANGGLVLPKQARIIFEDGAKLDFSDYATSGTSLPYMRGIGTRAAADLLTADAAIGGYTIVLGAGKGAAYSRGDFCVLNSNKDFTTQDETLGKQGEWVQIVNVVGDTLTTAAPLRDSYAMADSAKLTRYIDPCRLAIDNPQIIGVGKFDAGAAGDRGIEIIGGVGCTVTGGFIDWSDMFGVIFTNVKGGKIEGLHGAKQENAGANPTAYGVAIASACEDILVTRCHFTHGREGFCLTVSGDNLGVSRDIVFRGNTARGMWRSGFASHDTHANWRCESNIAEDCEQGFDCRIIDATFTKNKIKRMGAFSGSLNCGFQLGSGAGKLTFEGNVYEDMLRGIWMSPSIVHEALPGDIAIHGEVMDGIKGNCVLLDYRLAPNGSDTNPSGALGNVTIKGGDYKCVTSGSSPIPIVLHGQWTNPVISEVTFRGGAGGGAFAYLHATNNAGNAGASSPTVVDNHVESGYTEALIQHSTGYVKNRNKGIGWWMSGERLVGGKVFDFGEIAAGGSETTTVTLNGAAVTDRAIAELNTSGTEGVLYKAKVTAANTVTVRAYNMSGGPLNPGSAYLSVEVFKA